MCHSTQKEFIQQFLNNLRFGIEFFFLQKIKRYISYHIYFL